MSIITHGAAPHWKDVRVAWQDPSLAEFAPRSILDRIKTLSAALVVTIIDIALLYAVFAQALPDLPSWLVTVVAVGLGMAAFTTMGKVGDLVRGGRGNHPESRAALLLPALLAAIWLAVGIGIVVLRVLSEGRSTGVIAYEGSTAVLADATDSSVGLAIAATFFCIYLLAGALAYADSYGARNDAWHNGRQTLLAASEARVSLRHVEALYVQLLSEARDRQEDIARVDEVATSARCSNAALEAELRQVVRVDMAIFWGDPRRSGIASMRHPDNPLSAALDTGVGPHVVQLSDVHMDDETEAA